VQEALQPAAQRRECWKKPREGANVVEWMGDLGVDASLPSESLLVQWSILVGSSVYSRRKNHAEMSGAYCEQVEDLLVFLFSAYKASICLLSDASSLRNFFSNTSSFYVSGDFLCNSRMQTKGISLLVGRAR
jgi:hypothetical protein